MSKRKRRQFSPEFRAEAVKLVREQGLSRAQVARDLGLAESVIGRWVRLAVDASRAGALSPEERAELSQLRREVKTLRMEREILNKAAAFFARETR
jgi:transposase